MMAAISCALLATITLSMPNTALVNADTGAQRKPADLADTNVVWPGVGAGRKLTAGTYLPWLELTERLCRRSGMMSGIWNDVSFNTEFSHAPSVLQRYDMWQRYPTLISQTLVNSILNHAANFLCSSRTPSVNGVSVSGLHINEGAPSFPDSWGSWTPASGGTITIPTRGWSACQGIADWTGIFGGTYAHAEFTAINLLEEMYEDLGYETRREGDLNWFIARNIPAPDGYGNPANYFSLQNGATADLTTDHLRAMLLWVPQFTRTFYYDDSYNDAYTHTTKTRTYKRCVTKAAVKSIIYNLLNRGEVGPITAPVSNTVSNDESSVVGRGIFFGATNIFDCTASGQFILNIPVLYGPEMGGWDTNTYDNPVWIAMTKKGLVDGGATAGPVYVRGENGKVQYFYCQNDTWYKRTTWEDRAWIDRNFSENAFGKLIHKSSVVNSAYDSCSNHIPYGNASGFGSFSHASVCYVKAIKDGGTPQIKRFANSEMHGTWDLASVKQTFMGFDETIMGDTVGIQSLGTHDYEEPNNHDGGHPTTVTVVFENTPSHIYGYNVWMVASDSDGVIRDSSKVVWGGWAGDTLPQDFETWSAGGSARHEPADATETWTSVTGTCTGMIDHPGEYDFAEGITATAHWFGWLDWDFDEQSSAQ